MKKRIIIKGGKVHDVGYRLFLMETADEFGIENFYAKNIKEEGEEGVSVLIESKDINIEKFLKFVKENFPPNAKFSAVNVKEYAGDVKSLEAFRASFNSSQLAKIAITGVEMLKKQDAMLEKQDQTIKEVKTVGEKVDSGFEKTNQNFNYMDKKYDKMSEKMDSIDHTLKELTNAILKLAEKK